MANQIPQNIEYEKSLLGTFFYASGIEEQKDIEGRVASIVSSTDFYDPRTRAMYSTIHDLVENDIEVEFTSVYNHMIENSTVNPGDANNLLVELTNSNSTIANAEEYARDIREKAIARNLIDLMNHSNQSAHDPSTDPNDLIANIRQSLDKMEDTHEVSEFKSSKEVLADVIDEINEASKNQSGLKKGAIPSGFSYVDTITKGLQPNNLIILAARPAVGKTAFALNLAANAAKSKEIGKKHAVVFNMEMNESSMMFRLLSAWSTVPMNKLQTGNNLTTSTSVNDINADWAKINEANRQLSSLNLDLNATPGIRMSEVRSNLRTLDKQLKKADPESGIGLVVIDYLQLIEPDTETRDGRQNEISKISRSLKKLAGELNIPIVALSQLSRGVESRTIKRPMLSDLRDSGAIEQDADIVMFLYRDDYYDKNGKVEGEEGYDNSEESKVSDVELIIAKNRQGSNETVKLFFNKEIQQYGQLAGKSFQN
jgi:replicative DNA helicase